MLEETKDDTTIEEKIAVMEKVRLTALNQPSNTETNDITTTATPCNAEPVYDVEDATLEMKDTTSQIEMSPNVQQTKEKAMVNIRRAQDKQKRDYNRRCNPNNFEIGDEVLVEEVKDKSRCGGKLQTRFTGPYEILDVVRQGVYRLQKEGKPVKKSVNGQRLKPYFRRDKNNDSQGQPADTFSVCSQNPLRKMQMEINMESLLKPRYWLTDKEINASQNLLRKHILGVTAFRTHVCQRATNFRCSQMSLSRSTMPTKITGCCCLQLDVVKMKLMCMTAFTDSSIMTPWSPFPTFCKQKMEQSLYIYQKYRNKQMDQVVVCMQ